MAYNRQPQVTLAGLGLKQNPPPNITQPPGVIPVTLDAEIATTTSLGVVQVGSGLSITPEGILSATGGGGECCNAIVVSQDYTATPDDYYIGVDSQRPVTITLPMSVINCKQYVIKVEMGPPLGNRKVKIASPGTTIDGATSIVLTNPYESVSVLYRGGKWHIIYESSEDS
jgi:hypothetical protein